VWLLIALVAVALLPAVPVDLAFVYDNRPGGRRAARIIWGFGLIRVRLGAGRDRTGRGKPPRRRRPGRGRRARAAALTPGLPATVLGRMARVVRSFRVGLFEAHADLGTGDPADTGMLVGSLVGALAAISPTRQSVVTVTPDFERQRADLRARGRVRVVPGLVLWQVIALCSSATVLRALVRAARA